MSAHFLLLGRTELDVTWLRLNSAGQQFTTRQIVPVKIYIEMPTGYVGPAKGTTINGKFSPLTLEVPAGQFLPIIPTGKLPPTELTVTIESP